ncbi:MAG: accessory factor UbiK family protein [Pseudomonadales bacterium]|nr:accessory factor UbiK family protein [Pseudomonadales bacterium]NIX06717.1 accessory factor UbiK family protein [Pseudomonadales bacterium]
MAEHSSRQHSSGSGDVVATFIDRLTEQLASLVPPDSLRLVLDQARSALQRGLAEVDLVPRHELDAHLAALDRLTETMRDLERRVAALEADA